ncbi:MAG: carboxypeptidase-like regulatory domain-containing protein, partial [Ignavibacteriae bacterium]|nr:carboxypeptidase-like regulatory domain-containing protein [Ignavibacteriota bacterium]
MKRYIIVGLYALLPAITHGQVTITGKIVGKVVDQSTREPLIGATVFLVEHPRLGVATDINGDYFILNVPVGSFSLKASYVGYRDVTITNVRVSAGFTTEQNFELTSEAVEIGEVVVEARRPLIQKDQTNATSITTAEEIKNLPVRGFEGVVTVQTGVVSGRGTENNTFYTRGGRSNETIIYVDGFEQNNLLTGEATVSVNGNAIEEVQTQTGGFNAEYGRALSGVINVVTKEAAAKYTAQVEAESDFFMGDENSRGYNLYNLSLNGPLIPNYNDLTLFFSGELKNLATQRASQGTVGRVFRNGKFDLWNKGYPPNDRSDGYTLQSKLTFRMTPSAKLNLNLIHSNFTKQTYFDIYKFDLDRAPWDKDKNTTV